MAWGKKPWQGGTKKRSSDRELSNEYSHISYNVNSSYQSKRETANTVKGFLILAAFMIGTISFINWIAHTFGNH